MKTTVIGAFPKISDEIGGQKLRRALHQFDREEISRDLLDLVFDETTTAAIAQMEQAGINVVNDGQIRWDDLLAPFASAWGGVSRGPLERFYDTNTYFRQPVITGPIKTDGQTLVADFKLAQRSAKSAQVKASVCGPLTFATLAEDQCYQSFEERLAAVTAAIAREIQGLEAAGASLVDVEDPAIVARPELIGAGKEAYLLLGALSVPIALQTYFFPADRVIEELVDFHVAQIGIDVRSRETKVVGKLGRLPQTVVLGVVDARNTRIESADEVADRILEALKIVPSEQLWVAPTTSLEYLPHDVAVRKLLALYNGAQLTGALYHG